MGDYDFNSTSQNISYAGSSSKGFILHVVIYIIIAAGFLSVLVSIYAVFSLVRKDNTAPIYVINLLLADLIQLCSRSVLMTDPADIIWETFFYLYLFVLLVSVGFMMCISLERYLVISWPLWYRFRRTIKISVIVCFVVWVLPLVLFFPVYFWGDIYVALTTFGVFLLLPFPLFIFSLGGTLKALSAASRVPLDEKRRIVATLFLVLLIYTLLFLPSIIWVLAENTREIYSFNYLRFIMVLSSPIADSILYVLLRKGAVDKFSPLADLVLYVFMRKGTLDRLLACMCCCRRTGEEEQNQVTTTNNPEGNSVAMEQGRKIEKRERIDLF
ncbi:mas-related G-protein coupled receptor member B5-like [Channa argus]|uniref:mas-related G-protein coupled receptor member B5-like n=1 Tax=Channa argus TaxID=215402 RepID=UPI003522E531